MTTPTAAPSPSSATTPYTVPEAVVMLEGTTLGNPITRLQRDKLSTLIRALDHELKEKSSEHKTVISTEHERVKTLQQKDSELMTKTLELEHKNREIAQLTEHAKQKKAEMAALRAELSTAQAEPAAQFDALGVKANLRGGKSGTFWSGVAVGSVLVIGGLVAISKLIGWSFGPTPPAAGNHSNGGVAGSTAH